MKAIIKLRAINGYIEPKQFKRAINDCLEIELDTKQTSEFALEWNGQVYSFTDKKLTIPYEQITAENTLFVRANGKRYNCGKLYSEPYDTEMVEMLDIEMKYRQDIDRLMQSNERLQTALEKMKTIELKQKEIIQKYNKIIGGIDIFEKE